MNTLPSRIHDSKNGLDYTLVGDYYLPDLEIESSQPIYKYGRLRLEYLILFPNSLAPLKKIW